MKTLVFILSFLFLKGLFAANTPPVKKWTAFFDIKNISGSNGAVIQQSKYIPTLGLEYIKLAKDSPLGEEAYALGLWNTNELIRSTFQTQDQFELAYENSSIIFNTLSIHNENKVLSYLAAETSHFDFDRKISLLAAFLDKFAANYNLDRTQGFTPASKGTVSLKTMLSALESNLNSGTAITAGVCRDMHFGAIKMAKAMGLDEAFVLSYATNATSHMLLIANDPNDRAKTLTLSYSNITIKEGVSGIEALDQSGTLPEAGITYRIWNPNNAMAIALPTQKGAVLNTVTGGKDKDLDPFLTNKSSIYQVGAETKFGTIRLFSSKNSMGNDEDMQGATYNKQVIIKNNKKLQITGDYSVAGYSSSRNTVQGDLSSSGIYVKVDHKFVYKPIYDLSISSDIIARGLIGFNNLNGEKATSPDGSVDVNLDASYMYSFKNLQNSTGIQTRLQLGSLDGRSIYFVPMLFPSTTYLHHHSTLKLTEQVQATADLALGMRHFGNGKAYLQYEAVLGIDDNKSMIHVDVGSQGALSRDLPIWVPGSEMQGNISLQKGLLKNKLSLRIDGMQSFENTENRRLTLGVGGHF